MTNTNTNIFTRECNFPGNVTWNELFDLCDKAARMSKLLDRENAQRVSDGRAPFRRVTEEHNRVVHGIFDTIKHEAFKPWAEAQEMYEGDLPWLRYATHPSRF